MNRVLFVDDEALILNSLKRGLIEEDYLKVFATSGEQALQILAKDEISVLVTDMKMPGMTGLELLKEVKTLYPDMVKIVLSGYTHLPQVLVTVNQGDIFKFITKPWDLENEFKAVIREAVDYFNYRKELQRARNALETKNVTFQNILKSYDDKILAVKEELNLIKDLNIMIFREYNRLLKHWDVRHENKDFVLSKLSNLENLMIDVFALVPFSNRRFTSKSILEEIRKFIVDTQSLKRIELGVDSRTPVSLKGKYDLMLFVIKKAFILFFIESYDTSINIIVSGTTINDDETLLKIVMKSDSGSFSSGILQDAALLWMKELLSRLGFEIVEKEVGGSKALVLNMLFER